MATPPEENTSNSKPPQPDLSNSDPRHCRLLSPHPHADSSLQEGGLPSDHAQQNMQSVKISDDADPQRLIKERSRSILLRQQLLRTGSVSASTQVDDEYTAIDIPEDTTKSESAFECDAPSTSTMLNRVSSSTSPSSGINMEGSYVQTSDRTQQVHRRLRWTILGDSLMDVLVQGAFALIGLKTSNASSPAQDVLVRSIVIVYTLGLLSAIAGKLRGSSVMEGIGSAAAVLGFLLTMILLLL